MDATAGRPNLESGLRAQLEDRSRALAGTAVHRGWKAGFGTAAAMEKLGTSDPLVGYLTDETLLESADPVDVSAWGKAVLEPEVALRLGADLPADADPAAAAAAVDGVAAAIELVDLGAAGTDPEAILAANVFHRLYALGEFHPPAGAAALEAVRIDVFKDAAAVAEGADPRDLIGNLAGVLCGLARTLALGGEQLRAGDAIITGAAIPPFEFAGAASFRIRVGDSEVVAAVA